ncbi:MAG: sigma-70 family RNA polymerase sigma factor [Pyrinomonadaceae bacterium]
MPENSLPMSANMEELLNALLIYIPGAVRYACRIYQYNTSHDEFEDTCQDLIVLLIKNDYHELRAFRGASSIKTWIHTIARRHIGHRLHSGDNLTSLEDITPEVLAYQPIQDNEVLFKERMGAIEQSLANLPERSQMLLKLSIKGFTDVEISHLTGIVADAVRKHRHDIIKQLKILLGPT